MSNNRKAIVKMNKNVPMCNKFLANGIWSQSLTLNSQDLFRQLVNGISPLLDVEIIGFLVFNENTRQLEAQPPFMGLTPKIIDLYRISIPQESAAEEVWTKREIIIAPDAAKDQRLIDLGVDQVSRTVGIKNTVLVPLISGERSLGYLQVANKKNDGSFDYTDHRILAMVAGQAGPLIENTRLIQRSMKRAMHAEDKALIESLGRTITNQVSVAIQNASLFEETHRLTEQLELRVAERTEQLRYEHNRTQTLLQIMEELSSSLDLNHVLNRTLTLLNETTGAQQSSILLVRHADNTFHYRASLGSTSRYLNDNPESVLPLDDKLARWVISHRESLLIPDLSHNSQWTDPSKQNSEHRSAIAIPLMVGEEALGTILLFHPEPGTFTSQHREFVHAAANQIAMVVNNNELFVLIREQAESLGRMLRSQHIEASRSMSILEAVADGVLVTDSQNTITLFNQSAQNILNIDRNVIVGNSLDNFSGIFGGAAQSWTETIHEWSADPSSFESVDLYAERITIDNRRFVSIHLAPVVMNNEFLGTVSVFRDITHQVEVDRLKSEFVATVSHELRTPMTSIKGYIDVLLMGAAGPLNEQQESFLQVVKTNTERLNILVNDLLDVSRIEAGKVTLSIQPLDIEEIAREVIDEQLRQSEENKKPMNICFQIDPDVPRVPGDLERVRQIIANLVNNAFNYTLADGQITVKAHTIGDEVQIDIKDTGIGIKPQDRKKIFERFYRGEHPLVLACSGNGLGLSITQQLIEMHHGRIWMESSGNPGDGSVFSFTLPLHVHNEMND
jgi:signal transduction histidine kinase